MQWCETGPCKLVMNVTYQCTHKNSSSFFAEICTFHRFLFLVRHCQTTYKTFIIYLKYFKLYNSKDSFSCWWRGVHRGAKIAGRRPKRKTLLSVILIFFHKMVFHSWPNIHADHDSLEPFLLLLTTLHKQTLPWIPTEVFLIVILKIPG